MSLELTQKEEEMMCIHTYSKLNFWILKKDYEKVKMAIITAINNNQKFIEIEKNLFNISDIEGIHESSYIDEKDEKEERKLKLQEDQLNIKKLGYETR